MSVRVGYMCMSESQRDVFRCAQEHEARRGMSMKDEQLSRS